MALVNRGPAQGGSQQPWNQVPLTQLFSQGFDAMVKQTNQMAASIAKSNSSIANFSASMDKMVGGMKASHDRLIKAQGAYAGVMNTLTMWGWKFADGLKLAAVKIIGWVKSLSAFQAAAGQVTKLLDMLGPFGKKLKEFITTLNFDELMQHIKGARVIYKHRDALMGLVGMKPSVKGAVNAVGGGIGKIFGANTVGGLAGKALQLFPELAVLTSLAGVGQFQAKMANLTRSFGGYNKDFDNFTKIATVASLKIPMSQEAVIELGEAFQHMGISVRATNKDLDQQIVAGGQMMLMFGASAEQAAEWQKSIMADGGGIADVNKSMASFSTQLQVNNLGLADSKLILSESEQVWRKYGGSITDVQTSMLKAAATFKAFNIDAQQGMQSLNALRADPMKRLQANNLIAGDIGMTPEEVNKMMVTDPGKYGLAQNYSALKNSGFNSDVNDISQQRMMILQAQRRGLDSTEGLVQMQKFIAAHGGNTNFDEIVKAGKPAGQAASWDKTLESYRTSLDQFTTQFNRFGQSLSVMVGMPIFRILTPLLKSVNDMLAGGIETLKKYPGLVDSIVGGLLILVGILTTWRVGAGIVWLVATFGDLAAAIGTAWKFLTLVSPLLEGFGAALLTIAPTLGFIAEIFGFGGLAGALTLAGLAPALAGAAALLGGVAIGTAIIFMVGALMKQFMPDTFRALSVILGGIFKPIGFVFSVMGKNLALFFSDLAAIKDLYIAPLFKYLTSGIGDWLLHIASLLHEYFPQNFDDPYDVKGKGLGGGAGATAPTDNFYHQKPAGAPPSGDTRLHRSDFPGLTGSSGGGTGGFGGSGGTDLITVDKQGHKLPRFAAIPFLNAVAAAAKDHFDLHLNPGATANRTFSDQQRLWNELHGISPVAKPGTSNHEGKGAIDVANPAGAARYLEAAGFFHGDNGHHIPGDPEHFSFPHALARRSPTAHETEYLSLARQALESSKRSEETAKRVEDHLKSIKDATDAGAAAQQKTAYNSRPGAQTTKALVIT